MRLTPRQGKQEQGCGAQRADACQGAGPAGPASRGQRPPRDIPAFPPRWSLPFTNMAQAGCIASSATAGPPSPARPRLASAEVAAPLLCTSFLSGLREALWGLGLGAPRLHGPTEDAPQLHGHRTHPAATRPTGHTPRLHWPQEKPTWPPEELTASPLPRAGQPRVPFLLSGQPWSGHTGERGSVPSRLFEQRQLQQGLLTRALSPTDHSMALLFPAGP